jgi:hypothetical protein
VPGLEQMPLHSDILSWPKHPVDPGSGLVELVQRERERKRKEGNLDFIFATNPGFLLILPSSLGFPHSLPPYRHSSSFCHHPAIPPHLATIPGFFLICHHPGSPPPSTTTPGNLLIFEIFRKVFPGTPEVYDLKQIGCRSGIIICDPFA